MAAMVVINLDDLAAIRAAFATEAGKACAADRRVLAPDPGDVQMYLCDTTEV